MRTQQFDYCRLTLAVAMLCIASVARANEDRAATATIHEDATIGRIAIQRQNVFDTGKSEEDNAFFQLINRFHIMTREKVIAKQLLFEESEPYSEQLIEESERGLRRNRYLYDASISAKPQADGTVDITVDTRDVWTLLPELSIKRSGGENSSVIGIEEKNLFGNGQRVLLVHTEDVDRRSNTFEFSDRQFGQSWVSVALRIADNSDGHSNL